MEARRILGLSWVVPQAGFASGMRRFGSIEWACVLLMGPALFVGDLMPVTVYEEVFIDLYTYC